MNVRSSLSHTLNPFIRLLFIIVAAMTGLSGCFEYIKVTQPQKTVTPPVSTTQVATVLTPAECRITRVKMSSIPAENITINEADTSINVQLPETFIPKPFTVEYELNSENCHVSGSAKDEYNPCGTLFWFQSTVYWENNGRRFHARQYKVKYRSSGSLKLGDGQMPITMTIGEPELTSIRVVNYYGRLRQEKAPVARLTRETDGKEKSVSLICYSPTDGTDPSSSLLYVSTTLSPGEEGRYILSVDMPDGTKAQSSQPVIIRRSERVIVNSIDGFYCCSPKPGGTKSIFGYNLSPEYKPGIDLLDKAGNRTSLQIVEYGSQGQNMTVKIPESLKGGHYIYQITQNGLKTNQIGHFVIIDGPEPTFGYAFGQYSNPEPQAIPFIAGESIAVIFNPLQEGTKLKLTLKSNPTVQYLLDIVFTKESMYTGVYPPKITFPATMQPGEYSASLQQYLKYGSVVEGPSHLQTLLIRPPQ